MFARVCRMAYYTKKVDYFSDLHIKQNKVINKLKSIIENFDEIKSRKRK